MQYYISLSCVECYPWFIKNCLPAENSIPVSGVMLMVDTTVPVNDIFFNAVKSQSWSLSHPPSVKTCWDLAVVQSSLFVCLDFKARQHINGHIVPNAKIGLNYYVKRCK
jgi:hypothetical protein